MLVLQSCVLYPVIVIIGDNRDYTRVLLYSYYTTITGWGVLLRQTHQTRQELHMRLRSREKLLSMETLKAMRLGMPALGPMQISNPTRRVHIVLGLYWDMENRMETTTQGSGQCSHLKGNIPLYVGYVVRNPIRTTLRSHCVDKSTLRHPCKRGLDSYYSPSCGSNRQVQHA